MFDPGAGSLLGGYLPSPRSYQHITSITNEKKIKLWSGRLHDPGVENSIAKVG